MDGIARDAGLASAVVEQAAAGDAIAFARLVAAYHADMTRVAYVVTGGDQAMADDAVGAAWAIAWQKLGTLRDRERVRPWLVSVAANEARRQCRRSRILPTIELAADGPAALAAGDGPDPADRADVIDLERALHRLSPSERCLLALRYEAGLDSREIGALLGRPAPTIRWRLARLVGRLRKELRDA